MSSVAIPDVELVAGTSLWRDAWRRLRKNRLAVASGAFILAFVIACFAGPLLTSVTYSDQDLAYGPKPPSAQHWFGTDYLGRDLLVRTLYGGQMSLEIALLAAVVSLVIGTIYGAVSAYAGGTVDGVMMRVVDVLYSLPYIFLVILLVGFFGRNVILLFGALGAVQWLTTARIVRGQVLSLREKEFVLAARASGTAPAAIVFRHLMVMTRNVLAMTTVVRRNSLIGYTKSSTTAP